MIDTSPSTPAPLTPAALGVVWAVHAPHVDRFPWQLALADHRVVLLSAALDAAAVLPNGGEFREPDEPGDVPLPLIPPALLAAARAAVRDADRDEVAELLARRRQIAPVWGVPDVIAVRPDLTDDQAWAVLREVDRTHDPDAGVTWERLQDVAAALYGPAPDAD